MKKKSLLQKDDPSINFRLPQELKVKILKEADFNNKTVSNYIRDHMDSFLSGELYEKEIAAYEDAAFVNSTDFLQLVVWVYQKKGEYKHTVFDEIKQDNYISTIKSIGNQLPSELVDEFDKVLMDLMKVKNERGEYKYYTFCKTTHLYKDGFNYEKLEEYLLNFGIQSHVIHL